MPFYQYQCRDCENEYEVQHFVKDRYEEQCPECGGSVDIVVGNVSVHSFAPHFSQALGVFVKSRGEEKTILKVKGLEDAGDMRDQSKIFHQARYHQLITPLSHPGFRTTFYLI